MTTRGSSGFGVRASARLIVSLWLGFSAAAAEVPKPPVGPEIKTSVDKKAEEVLRAVTDQFKAAKSAEADLNVTVRIEGPGVKQDLPSKYSLAVERPNRYALTLLDGITGTTVISDGTNVTTFIPMLNRYMVAPAPKDLSGLKEGAVDGLGGMTFIGALFDTNSYAALLAGVSEVKYAGAENGLHRLEFKQESMNWTLLAESGEKSALRRIETDLSKMAGAGALPPGMEEMLKAFKMTMVMEFGAWKFNPAFAADRFRFTPPEGAQRTDDMVKDLAGKGPARDGDDSDLVGEAAPEFKAQLIGGGQFDSASAKDQPLAVIFWAGEAEHTIKVIETVSAWAATAGVKAVFINAGEPKDKAAAFVQKRGWKGTFALDPGGQITEDFEVEGVPKTFLIDRHGAVQRAYLGFHDDLKGLLAKDAETLGVKAAK